MQRNHNVSVFSFTFPKGGKCNLVITIKTSYLQITERLKGRFSPGLGEGLPAMCIFCLLQRVYKQPFGRTFCFRIHRESKPSRRTCPRLSLAVWIQHTQMPVFVIMSQLSRSFDILGACLKAVWGFQY